jgi:methionyl-tRNA formyltransferase
MKISILTPLGTWYEAHGILLLEAIRKAGHEIRGFTTRLEDIEPGDCLFILSWPEIIPSEFLRLNSHSVVVHSSALPEGRGWSPLTWEILKGRKTFTNTLFEAVAPADAGPIYLQNTFALEGHELLPEAHLVQGASINALCLGFLKLLELEQRSTNKLAGLHQKHENATFYSRRKPSDSRIDPDRSLAEQFDLLRTVDNEDYPAFFDLRGHRYTLTIRKETE